VPGPNLPAVEVERIEGQQRELFRPGPHRRATTWKARDCSRSPHSWCGLASDAEGSVVHKVEPVIDDVVTSFATDIFRSRNQHRVGKKSLWIVTFDERDPGLYQRPLKRTEYGTSLENGPLLNVSSPIWTVSLAEFPPSSIKMLSD
jgi:hypothetical protein